jgi:hypothetical protein
MEVRANVYRSRLEEPEWRESGQLDMWILISFPTPTIIYLSQIEAMAIRFVGYCSNDSVVQRGRDQRGERNEARAGCEETQ